MIIFLYGPDSYRRQKKQNEIINQYREKHLTFGHFDLGNSEAEEEFFRLQKFSANNSLFEKEKLASVENVFGEFIKTKSKDFINFLKANFLNKDLTIVISEEKSPLKNFNFLVKEPVLFQEFKNLEGERLNFFIRKEAKERNLELSTPAVNFLAGIFKGDLWGLANELEKLSLLNSKNIDINKLKELADYYQPMANSEFFSQINNFFFGRSVTHRIINLEILLSHQEEPAKIFNFGASFSKNSTAVLRKFADYDVAIKFGKLDYEEALVDLALSLS